MSRINIRCCCNAGKLIGSVEIGDVQQHQGYLITIPLEHCDGEYSSDHYPVVCTTLTLEMAYAFNKNPAKGPVFRELALKSNDLPIELFRRIPSFVEAT